VLASPVGLADGTVDVLSATGFPTEGPYDIDVEGVLTTVTAGQGTTTGTVTRYSSVVALHAAWIPAPPWCVVAGRAPSLGRRT
jgi:hypothetical protein